MTYEKLKSCEPKTYVATVPYPDLKGYPSYRFGIVRLSAEKDKFGYWRELRWIPADHPALKEYDNVPDVPESVVKLYRKPFQLKYLLGSVEVLFEIEDAEFDWEDYQRVHNAA